MKVLRLLLWLIAILIFLSILKSVLLAIKADSLEFYYNLLGSLQLFLLGGVICWLLFSIPFYLVRKKMFPFLPSLVIYLLVLIAGEITSLYLLKHADRVSGNMRNYLMEYY